VTDGPRDERHAAEAAFTAGRPYEALTLLGTASKGGLDPDLIADAVAVLARTHGMPAAGGALALGDAIGAAGHPDLEASRTAMGAHRMRRLLPEVIGRIVFLALRPRVPGNFDPERWPDRKPIRTPEEMVGTVRYILEHAEELEWIADRLDAPSREVLTQRLVYLALDHELAQIGPSVEHLAQLSEVIRADLLLEERVRGLGYLDSVARRDFIYSHRFDLTPLGYPITIETSMFGVQGTYQLEQYRAPHHPAANVRPGDVVVDGGGYLGETALYYAHHVGPTGRVVTFEFEDSSLEVLDENLAANPELAARISVRRHALWDESGHELPILVSGPGTTLTGPAAEHAATATQLVTTETIDDLVDGGELERVDLLKLDIEGAEAQALAGARRTLERFKPRLAIAAYHQFDDMWKLAKQLDVLDLGYQFAMAHYTPHNEETVLYAWVEEDR
jgi:FkbM family methyltransferase